jgi:choline dehydrogenase
LKYQSKVQDVQINDEGILIEGYEYVIIGSGPDGGPLAAHLARNGHKVLLLKAGNDQGDNLNE